MTSLVPFTERLQSIELVVGVGGPGQPNSLIQFFYLGFAELPIETFHVQVGIGTSAHFSVLPVPRDRTAHSHNRCHQQQSGERLEISRKTNDLSGWSWGQRTLFLEDFFELFYLRISLWTLRHLANCFQQLPLRFQVNLNSSICVAECSLQVGQVRVVWTNNAFGLGLLSHHKSVFATQG